MLEHDRLQRVGKLRSEERVEESFGVGLPQCLQPQPCRAGPVRAPARTNLQELGSRRREQEQRAVDMAHDRGEEVEEVLLGPVHVFDQEDRRSLTDELVEELEPRVVQALAHDQRMEILRDREPERQTEERTPPEPLRDDLRRVALEDLELLAQHLRERPVRYPLAVREASAGPAQGLGGLRAEPLPQLPHESRLADPRVAEDRHEPRLPRGDDCSIRVLQVRQLAVSAHECSAHPTHAARAHQRECA